jgi:hypothetical protein
VAAVAVLLVAVAAVAVAQVVAAVADVSRKLNRAPDRNGG